MADQDHRRETIERDLPAWERRALKAEKALRERDEELLGPLLSEKAKAAGAARLRNRNSMLPWHELGPSMKRAEIEAAGHVIKGALDFVRGEAR